MKNILKIWESFPNIIIAEMLIDNESCFSKTTYFQIKQELRIKEVKKIILPSK